MVRGEVVGEEGDLLSTTVLSKALGEINKVGVLDCSIERVELGHANVEVDRGNGGSELGPCQLLVDHCVAVHPGPVEVLIRVLGPVDLVNVEEKSTLHLCLVELLENLLRRRRILLLARVVERLHLPHLLLLDPKLSIERSKLRRSYLSIYVLAMEEECSVLQR